MLSKFHTGALAAAFIAISVGAASANAVYYGTTQADNTASVGPISGSYYTTDSADAVNLTPGTTVGFGDILSPAPASYSDDYYFTTAVNSTFTIFGFTGSSTQFKLVAEDSTPTIIGSASSPTGGVLTFPVTLTAGTIYELIVSGNTTSNPASYAGNFVASTPLPAGLPLIAGGLGLVGWLSRGRKQKLESKAVLAA